MSHTKQQSSGQAYMTTNIRTPRLPILTNRYLLTTNAKISITSNNPSLSQREQRDKQKSSINDELFSTRKRSFLYSQAYRRTQIHKKIEQQNSRLHKRINSQKSLYSQESLRKSSVSVRSISRNNSRQSTRKNKTSIKQRKDATKNKQKQENIQINQQKVQKMQKQHIKQFRNMFLGTFEPKKQSKHVNKINTKTLTTSFNLRQQSTNTKRGTSVKMGNMLHLIAEQLFQQPVNKNKVSGKKMKI